ncbi:MAG: M64 family metallopeptidase [Flavitalea sp.]
MRKFNLNRKNLLKASMSIFIASFIFSQAHSQSYPIDTLMRNGERNNRIKFVWLSDGYQMSDLPSFKTNAMFINNELFSQTPFAQYKNFFNSYAIRVPSLESGAKHPGNATDEATSGGQPILNTDNNFGSTFDYDFIHRLLVPVKTTDIFNTLANNFADYSEAIVLVNSPYYGGSGGDFPTASADIDAAEIAIHELGHSFGGLADEYWAGDIYAFEKPNMTANSDPATVKWNKWVGINGIGVYPHGSSGNEANWFKPHEDCKMQYLDAPFCSVCTETFIDVIHQGVNMIDANTPSSTSFALSNKNDVNFSITAIQTIPSTVNIKWYLNGSATPFSTDQYSVVVPFTSFNSGNNTVRAEVIDNTPLSKSYLPAVGYIENLSWTIFRPAAALPVHLKSFSGKVNNDAALLNWEIDSPDDLNIFELEKSKDGLDFSMIASIAGQALKTNYNYTDQRIFSPYTYYRLKTIEKSGFSHYSSIIRLQKASDKFYYKVYQNADNHRYHLSMGLTNQEKVSFRVTDIQGKLILKKDFGKVEKQVEYDFDLSGRSSGIYFMTLFVNNYSYTIQLLAK